MCVWPTGFTLADGESFDWLTDESRLQCIGRHFKFSHSPAGPWRQMSPHTPSRRNGKLPNMNVLMEAAEDAAQDAKRELGRVVRVTRRQVQYQHNKYFLGKRTADVIAAEDATRDARQEAGHQKKRKENKDRTRASKTPPLKNRKGTESGDKTGASTTSPSKKRKGSKSGDETKAGASVPTTDEVAEKLKGSKSGDETKAGEPVLTTDEVAEKHDANVGLDLPGTKTGSIPLEVLKALDQWQCYTEICTRAMEDPAADVHASRTIWVIPADKAKAHDGWDTMGKTETEVCSQVQAFLDHIKPGLRLHALSVMYFPEGYHPHWHIDESPPSNMCMGSDDIVMFNMGDKPYDLHLRYPLKTEANERQDKVRSPKARELKVQHLPKGFVLLHGTARKSMEHAVLNGPQRLVIRASCTRAAAKAKVTQQVNRSSRLADKAVAESDEHIDSGRSDPPSESDREDSDDQFTAPVSPCADKTDVGPHTPGVHDSDSEEDPHPARMSSPNEDLLEGAVTLFVGNRSSSDESPARSDSESEGAHSSDSTRGSPTSRKLDFDSDASTDQCADVERPSSCPKLATRKEEDQQDDESGTQRGCILAEMFQDEEIDHEVLLLLDENADDVHPHSTRLFRAGPLVDPQSHMHVRLRRQLYTFILQNYSRFEEFGDVEMPLSVLAEEVRNPGMWCGDVAISALAQAFKLKLASCMERSESISEPHHIQHLGQTFDFTEDDSDCSEMLFVVHVDQPGHYMAGIRRDAWDKKSRPEEYQCRTVTIDGHLHEIAIFNVVGDR